jgi:DNA-binding response OmpR family regulator
MSLPRRVLIVDDERLIADTLALILTRHGFETTAVYSGEAAMEAAATVQPDVMITDVIMDGLNGIEVATRLSTIHPGCRVILFSGQLETADLLQDAERRGHRFEIMPKPVYPEDLLALLNAPHRGVV